MKISQLIKRLESLRGRHGDGVICCTLRRPGSSSKFGPIVTVNDAELPMTSTLQPGDAWTIVHLVLLETDEE